jgi:hypothetical protein
MIFPVINSIQHLTMATISSLLAITLRKHELDQNERLKTLVQILIVIFLK